MESGRAFHKKGNNFTTDLRCPALNGVGAESSTLDFRGMPQDIVYSGAYDNQ